MLVSLVALIFGGAQATPPRPPVVTTPSPPRPNPPIIYTPVPPRPSPPLASPPPPPPPRVAPPTPPRPRSGSISSDDYPAAAIRAGDEGTTAVRLEVSPQGRVTSCTVTTSSGSSVLDSTTCRLVSQRWRYEPARSSSGAPVSATVPMRVTWRLPDEPVIAFAQGRLTWSVQVTPSGVQGCSAELIGTAFAGFEDGLCADPEEGLVDRAEMGAGQTARVVNVLSLLPAGESLTLPRLAGVPFAETVAELEIAPDGRVTTCTPVVQRGGVPSYAHPLFPDLCEDLPGGSPRFAPTAGTEARRARMHSALFVEMGRPRRR